MKKPKSPRHWLDKAAPLYWKPRECWRVRAMRAGTPYQWILDAGRGDSGSMGRALATADWQRKHLEIVRAERAGNDDGWPLQFKTREEEQEHYAILQDRANYHESPLAASMSYEDWREFVEFKEWHASKSRSQRHDVEVGSNSVPGLPSASGSKPFKELTAIFRAHLEHRLKQTKPGLKSKKDLSESRFIQYGFALAHLDKKFGETPIAPVGEFHIGEKHLAHILVRYRQACDSEMTASGFGGHWFNERMKTARSLVSYLAENRLLSGRPPNIAALTEKYKIEASPKPIPPPVLKAIWNAADPEFRGFMLLALNCGFRQTEIQSLDHKQLKTISRQLCVVKLRGKTGQPIALPLWASTQRFITKYANAEGKLFSWENGKTAIAVLYHQMKSIRERVAKTMPKVKEYSFEHFRDTGASYFDSVNPMLTALYLGQGDTRQVKQYVAAIEDENGKAVVPMQLDKVLAMFEDYLNLPAYQP